MNKLANWGLWRMLVSKMWTEYTLYFITGRCTNTFDMHHFHYTTSSLNSSGTVNLCGLSVWSYDDWTSSIRNQLRDLVINGLRWRRREIEQADGGLIIDHSAIAHGLFTVLQGRQNINPNLFHQLLYPLFIIYLKEHNSTKQIAHILDLISKQLIEY